MATLNLEAQSCTIDGVEPVFEVGGTDFQAGDDFIIPNNGRLLVIVRNESGQDLTVTATSTATVQGLPVGDQSIVVPAGETTYAYGFRVATFGPTLQLTFPAATDISVAILQL